MSTSTPVFSFGQVQDPSSSDNHNHNHSHNHNNNTTTPSTFPSFTNSFSSPYEPQYRPKISSPLSSSPIRPFDPITMSRSSPPRSPTSKPRGIFGGQTQSSPIFGSLLQNQGEASNQNGQAVADGQQGQGREQNKFLKYNSRPSRPMNHPSFSSNRKEDRRRFFLQNVRQRADDKAWERRGGENELLKLEWLRFNRELRLAKEASAPPNPFSPNGVQSHTDSFEEEMEELAQLRAKFNHQQQFLEGLLEDQPPGQDMDAYMAEMIAREEEAELEALLALNQQAQEDLRVRGGQEGQGQLQHQGQQQQGDLMADEDDDEYDELFMEVLAQQQGQLGQQHQQQQASGSDLGIQHHHHSQDDVEMGG
ncbi:hypothetical protein SMACR_05586 [Sordaria macrospora]|uniref:WGS project CABT00000000 data, contig 2.26 n=2 Tax=Sordaria macrospora TaxID=5147 RepID=F7W455_SORMK|nr:uncharacterized protein SMAC_05586 [Sordaria macrospora k-hell]KAA8627912.1 hypothetical protein SMACR_05586 [Sordaria macrospora]KAH7633875.1 hypothetical protein B0T09DRAFT_99809 [Sordaria sp. MPI-SDFR-AT-0083]WPJ59764.1 hypothetical protein SMAC4_05586 [Sordaria macrospora]CCC12409.1 unnamed protein product [Sordaria macrospora k-hell]